MATLMECGCIGQGTRQDGSPVCISHYGIHPGADVPAEEVPDLTGRMASCPYCSRTEPSSLDLPFFAHQPNSETDSMYNGCRGWD
jgi:hypothetical protein